MKALALKKLIVKNFKIQEQTIPEVCLSYEHFGCEIGTAPVVVINHALTGNSTVLGENGWWKPLVGSGKLIDTDQYCILAFNIPGNGYDGTFLDNYRQWKLRDVSHLFVAGLRLLSVEKLFAVIGGSIGGALAWEMAASYPKLIENIIPIATDWKATDWLLANTRLQAEILENSSKPVHDARLHAMLCYRTPESFRSRFNRSVNEAEKLYNIETWLLHHGKKLQERFQLQAYKTMNHLLSTIDITEGRGDFVEVVSTIQGNIYLVSIDTDLFFTNEENRRTYTQLMPHKKNVFFKTIRSVHGHDAFLMEYEQLTALLSPIFKQNISIPVQ